MSLMSKSFPKQDIISITPDKSVFEAAKIMATAKVGSILILDNDKLAGIFTERDLLNTLIAKGLDPEKTKISEAMTKNVATVDLNDTVDGCYQKMQAATCRHMPILENGKVIGMVTMKDILRKIMAEIGDENRQLKDYIFTT